MHVRGPSAKEKVKMNQKLIVFLFHIKAIYSWTGSTF